MRTPLPLLIPLTLACGTPPALVPPSSAAFEQAAAPATATAADASPASRPKGLLVILAVADLGHAAAFYRAVFDWRVVDEAPTFVSFDLGEGRQLGLFARASFATITGHEPEPPRVGAVTGTEVYLRYPDPTPLLERALARGARLLAPLAARPWGEEVAYVADPDGNVLALARVAAPAPATPTAGE